MRKNYKYKKKFSYKSRNHINPMKSIFCAVFAIFFAIAFAVMWIGIHIEASLYIIVGTSSVGLCLLLAISKWIKAYKRFSR